MSGDGGGGAARDVRLDHLEAHNIATDRRLATIEKTVFELRSDVNEWNLERARRSRFNERLGEWVQKIALAIFGAVLASWQKILHALGLDQ